MTDFSAFDEGTTNTPPDKLAAIVKLATEGATMEREVATTMGLLELQSGRAHEIKTKLLPDAMAEAGMSNFSLEDGTGIKVEDFVSGSLPKIDESTNETFIASSKARADALRFLEENDGASLIKNVISVSFDKSQHNEALALAAELREKGFDCEVKSDVHPQSYMAWAREALKSGVNLDPDLLNLFIGRVAKLDIPGFVKPKKRKKGGRS